MRANPAFALALAAFASWPLAAQAAAAERWEIVGTTYNSIIFLDRGSVRRSGSAVDVTALRMITGLQYSGHPDSRSGWTSSLNHLSLDCAKRTARDRGTRVEMPWGKVETTPPIAKPVFVPARGPMHDLFAAVCSSAIGRRVADPQGYAKAHFRPH